MVDPGGSVNELAGSCLTIAAQRRNKVRPGAWARRKKGEDVGLRSSGTIPTIFSSVRQAKKSDLAVITKGPAAKQNRGPRPRFAVAIHSTGLCFLSLCSQHFDRTL